MDDVLSYQRYSKDINGLGYSKFNKTSKVKKNIFVKSSNTRKNVQTRKVENNLQRNCVRNSNYTPKKNICPIIYLHAFIVIVTDILLIHVTWENMVYQVVIMFG